MLIIIDILLFSKNNNYNIPQIIKYKNQIKIKSIEILFKHKLFNKQLMHNEYSNIKLIMI